MPIGIGSGLDLRHSCLAGLRPHPAVPGRGRARADTAAEPRNELLAALPRSTLDRLRPLLTPVDLRRRQVLHERNVPVQDAYFIECGAASMLSRSSDRQPGVEVALLGRCDLVGLPLVLGTGRTPHRCVVQVPGRALRIGAVDLGHALGDFPCLRKLLLAYVQAVLVQGTQLMICNSQHTLEKRLARWLLAAGDRLGGEEIPLTHQSLSRAIGVRRAGVTVAVGRMERAGMVRRGRGCLTVLDRTALEGVSCECYRAIRAEQGRIVCAEV